MNTQPPAPPPTPHLPRITIALCTYNGAAHLDAQLQSYVAQNHANWDLWISDDGSTDGTLEILDRFARDHGTGRDIRILHGPRAGVAQNFLSLLCHPDLPAQPTALSDQDDVWMPHKLTHALTALAQTGGTPALYGAQSIHTDTDLTPQGRSIGGGVASFGNALVQNIVSGHSATLNAAALALVRAAGVPADVPYQDWWLYQLVTGAGGQVIVAPDAVLFYRQHEDNAMGAHSGLNQRLNRLFSLFGQEFSHWITANTKALSQPHVHALLNADTQTTLKAVQAAPRAGPGRLRVIHAQAIRRQDRASTLALYLAALLGRV